MTALRPGTHGDPRGARVAFGPAVPGHSIGMSTSTAKVTWKPHEEHGELSAADRRELPDSAYAFPGRRKEPLTDARHVRAALARFDQVRDVTDRERDQAFANIKAAAKHYAVEVAEDDWHDLGKRPHTDNPAH
jgi:Family of unknown function (DUF6582)